MKTNLQFSALITGALLVGSSFSSYAADFTVNDTIDSVDINPGNGVCATESGSCSLRAAVMEANALQGADTISLSAGTYTISRGQTGEDLGAEGDLDILDDLTIDGAGVAETEVNSNAYSHRLFSVLNKDDGTSPNVSISNLTLTKGLANDDAALIYNEADLIVDNVLLTDAGQGANAIYNAGGSLTISKSEVSNNYRGIYLNQGRASISNSTFKQNNTTTLADSESSYDLSVGAGAGILSQFSASSIIQDSLFLENESLNGGAIYSGGNIAIENCEFEGNAAKQPNPERYQGFGGAVFIVNGHQTSNSTIKNSLFVSNTADFTGGAVSSQADSLVVIGSSFTANKSISSSLIGGSGGAISSGPYGYLTLIDSSFTLNEAGGLGGAIYDSHHILASNIVVSENESGYSGGGMHVESGFISNSRIVDNSATSNSGGIMVYGNVDIRFSEVSGNSAESAGGIHIAGDAIIRNSTIANNSAASSAGGLKVGSEKSLELINSTLANNLVSDDRDYNASNIQTYGNVSIRNTIIHSSNGTQNCYGEVSSLGNNLSNDSTCGMDWETDLYTIAPRLGELQDNGGHTHTMALEEDSPAINAGNAEYCNSDNVLDQRSYHRADGACDIGAYEVGSVEAVTGSLSFSASNYEGEEDSGSITVTVNRSGGSEGEALAWLYDVGQGEATSAEPIEGINAWYDYDQIQPITLRWADGDNSAKTFDISIHDDYTDDDETIILGLAQASSATLVLSEATVTIIDLDGTDSIIDDNETDDPNNEGENNSDDSDESNGDDQDAEQGNEEVNVDEPSTDSSGGGAINPLLLIALVIISFCARRRLSVAF